MSSDAQDLAVARYLKQGGMVTPGQLDQALQIQARSIDLGKPVTLAAALVEVGAITPVQKEALEKKITAEEKKGTQQLLHYRLLKKLGEGAMGVVYLAEDTKEKVKVALKILPRKHAADPEFMKRFRRESEAACRLRHPNIVRAFEAGEDVGYHFYVMEYCEGEALDAALKRAGILPWSRSLEIVRDVARGLQYAHAQGFIHRDIKPANIFITLDGMSKILDLGLSKNIDEADQSFRTLSGAVVGTPHYISPEQATSAKSIDGRTDYYSLGATLYHLLTGEPPFSGTTLYEILSKHVNAELPNPQDLAENIPDGVVHVLRKMMAKSANDRYGDGGELIRDLDLVLQGQGPQSPALEPGASAVAHLPKRIDGARRKRAGTYRAVRPPSSKKFGVLLWGGLAIASATLLGLVMMRQEGTPSRPSAGASPPEPAHIPDAAGARLTLDLGDGVLMGLLYIAPGSFTMGGTEAPHYDWQRDERPAHEVTLTKGFYLGRYKVTRGQFAAFVKATGYKTEAEREGKAWGRPLSGGWAEIPGASWRNPVYFAQEDDHPVICVSWGDAKAFCDWLTQKSRRRVKLPTEAEWEYASRAGTKTTWPFGDLVSAVDEYAWTSANSEMHTHPVGLKKPNAWGLYDMYGNAFEWCQDWFGPYPGGPVTDPEGPRNGDRRCLRGGSWVNEAAICRPALRHVHPPWNRDTEDGFRVTAR
jgi:formylglycine-generating enzyme required for sulfatase activity